MPTSELTDALNPFVGQQQQQQQQQPYSEQHAYTQPFQAVHTPQSSSFVPHRSELEYAISEPPPPPRCRSSCPVVLIQPSYFSGLGQSWMLLILYRRFSALGMQHEKRRRANTGEGLPGSKSSKLNIGNDKQRQRPNWPR